ncbi:MAG: hypothetical protein RG741_03405 [Bacteroidales bacterium]|nr:hypothetical protein [Bacteroidales bacterium]
MHQRDTIINKFEKAGLATVFVVMLLRVWLGPEANFVLLVTTTLLSIYYLWFGFFIFNKLAPIKLLDKTVVRSLSSFRVFLSIFMGIIASYALIAILTGFFFYPLMPYIIGSAFMLMVVFTTYLITYQLKKKPKLPVFRRFYYRAALFILFLGALFLTPREARLELLFRDYPEFIEAYIQYREHPEDDEALQRLREERSRFR